VMPSFLNAKIADRFIRNKGTNSMSNLRNLPQIRVVRRSQNRETAGSSQFVVSHWRRFLDEKMTLPAASLPILLRILAKG